MLTRETIVFRRGEIITKEVLNSLAREPAETFAAFCADFPDGIVRGLDFKEASDGSKKVMLTGGVVIVEGELYSGSDSVDLTELLGSSTQKGNLQKYRLCLKLQERKMRRRRLLPTLEPEEARRGEGLIIARLSAVDKKIRLPRIKENSPHPLSEFKTGSIDLLNSPYLTGEGQKAVAPLLRRAIAKFLQTKQAKDGADWALLMAAINAPLSWATVRAYIAGHASHLLDDDASPARLLEELERALVSVRYAASNVAEQKPTATRPRQTSREGLMTSYRPLE